MKTRSLAILLALVAFSSLAVPAYAWTWCGQMSVVSVWVWKTDTPPPNLDPCGQWWWDCVRERHWRMTFPTWVSGIGTVYCGRNLEPTYPQLPKANGNSIGGNWGYSPYGNYFDPTKSGGFGAQCLGSNCTRCETNSWSCSLSAYCCY